MCDRGSEAAHHIIVRRVTDEPHADVVVLVPAGEATALEYPYHVTDQSLSVRGLHGEIATDIGTVAGTSDSVFGLVLV